MKKRLFAGIILVAFIAISTFLLIFYLGRNNKHVNADQVSQEAATPTVTVSPAIDYTELNSAVEAVPDYYTFVYGKAVASNLTKILDYVEANKSTMDQEAVNEYATKIRAVINSSSFTLSEVPQIYLEVSNEYPISQDYTSASIAVIDAEGGNNKDIIDMSGQIKIRGNSTTQVPKKNYTIKFSKKEDVLGMGEAKKWVLVANAFDKTLMRNKLVFDFASAIGLQYTPDTAYVDVWLNGRPIGSYLLLELIEVSPSRVDINTDKGDYLIEREYERSSFGTAYFMTPDFGTRFGVTAPKNITQEKVGELRDFLGKVEEAMRERDWETFTSLVDEKSYIDFYILSELFKTVDFDYASTRFYIKTGKLFAGPPWDYDLSSGNAASDFYVAYNYHDGYGPFSSYIGLWCNKNFYRDCYDFPEFKAALIQRYNELQDIIKNLYEDNILGTNQIDLLLEKYGKSFERNYTTAGWTLLKEFHLERYPDSTYEQNVEYLRGWLEKRNEFLSNSWK